MSEPDNKTQRTVQAALLLALLGASGGLLYWAAAQSQACGDGVCMDGEAASCPVDCATGVALAQAPTPMPLQLPSEPVPVEVEAATEPPPPKPPAPKPPPPKPPPVAVQPPPKPPAPAPKPPPGRCADPRFAEVARDVVKECTAACKKDDNPIVDLSPEEFEAIFGQPDDAGVASHFALFGCNRYGAGGRSCLGFDSDAATPGDCPAGARGDACRRYASVLEQELGAFLDQHRGANYLILMGTASRTGNDAGTMSEDNAALAERRALAVQRLVNEYRRRHGLRDMRVLAVVLDNTRLDYAAGGTFPAMIADQLAKLGARTVDRGFTPSTANAMNRSVLAVAIHCDL